MGDQSSRSTELVPSSSQSVSIPTASQSSYPEYSDQIQSVSDVPCPGSSSTSCSSEHTHGNFRTQARLVLNEIDSVDHNVIATTGPSGMPGTAPETGDAESDDFAIDSDASLDHLVTLFQATLSREQISAIFNFAFHDFDKAMECLLSGPNLNNILQLMSKVSKTCPIIKVHIDEDDVWSDLVSFYKASNADISRCRIRIRLNGQPAIDTGGVRCQVYTSVLQKFSENQPFKLFDGPPNSLRPYYSAVTRCSGMFKVLGSIVGHSIFQDGIGFPHLSAVCYWYIAAGEEEALQFLTLDDVGADCCNFVNQVS